MQLTDADGPSVGPACVVARLSRWCPPLQTAQTWLAHVNRGGPARIEYRGVESRQVTPR